MFNLPETVIAKNGVAALTPACRQLTRVTRSLLSMKSNNIMQQVTLKGGVAKQLLTMPIYRPLAGRVAFPGPAVVKKPSYKAVLAKDLDAEANEATEELFDLFWANSQDLRSTTAMEYTNLKKHFAEIPAGGNSVLTVKNLTNGLRGVPTLMWETSTVSPNDGILYRNLELRECLSVLKSVSDETRKREPDGLRAKAPPVEALWWFLMTGRVPRRKELDTAQLTLDRLFPRDRVRIRGLVDAFLSLPPGTNPMTMFLVGLSYFQNTSTQGRKNSLSTTPGKADDLAASDQFSDTAKLLAVLPLINGLISRRAVLRDEAVMDQFYRECEAKVAGEDWAGRLCRLMLRDDDAALAKLQEEFLRLFVFVHADHEGGNASAHLAGIVGSTGADIYYSMVAASCGLAGPLHGLANQQSLNYQRSLLYRLAGNETTPQAPSSRVRKAARTPNQQEKVPFPEAAWKSLAVASDIDMGKLRGLIRSDIERGRIIPGYGHAVLRRADPRFRLLDDFASSSQLISGQELFHLNKACCSIVPEELRAKGKASNPFPNIDNISGVILHCLNFTDTDMFPVLFAVSRAVGVSAGLVWQRILRFPLERPRSLTVASLARQVFSHSVVHTDKAQENRKDESKASQQTKAIQGRQKAAATEWRAGGRRAEARSPEMTELVGV